jgi:hypothetical protein
LLERLKEGESVSAFFQASAVAFLTPPAFCMVLLLDCFMFLFLSFELLGNGAGTKTVPVEVWS